MKSRTGILILTLLLAPLALGQVTNRSDRSQEATTIIGPRNIPLYDGAQALLAGDDEKTCCWRETIKIGAAITTALSSIS